MGREDLVTDPRFAATSDRRANARLLTALLDELFATKDWAAWSPILEKTGVAFGVVGTLDDIPHDAQMRASGALMPIDDPRAGASFTVSSPLQVGVRTRCRRRSPRRSGSTRSKCCAPPAFPPWRSSDCCKPE